ncbi:hypothetical protein PIB30_025004 [Stylosanthes scabra]|uniref:F-box domain-containing protein n=1 Tax=Stylosanthes scabra TaxID=79078 RepID=A0ABU6Z6N1_9FABA|nr:hypothetical protein [Stylosanthes scabra]
MAPMPGNLLGTTDKRPKPSPQILPDELIEEILVRVPASTIVKLKIVCKSWNALICSSEFARFHLDRSRSDPRLVYGFERDRKMRFVPMRSVFNNPDTFTTYSSIKMDGDLQILGSCNGLICIGSMRKRKGLVHLKSIRFWNPCTRSASDWLKVKGQKGKINMCGFGYDKVHDNYKFLYGHKILILGSKNSWKSIVHAAIGTFVKGSLNWAAHAHSDFGKWVMEEYGIEESWARLFCVIGEVQGHRGPFKALYMTQDDAAVAVFSPGDYSFSSWNLKIVRYVACSSKVWNYIYYRVLGAVVGRQNLYVYRESLMSPSHY